MNSAHVTSSHLLQNERCRLVGDDNECFRARRQFAEFKDFCHALIGFAYHRLLCVYTSKVQVYFR